MADTLMDQMDLYERGVISLIGAGGKTSLMFRLAEELAGTGKKVLTTTTVKIFIPDKNQSPFTIITRFIEKLIAQSNSCLNRFSHFSAGSATDPGTGKLLGFSPQLIDQLWEEKLFDWIIVEADGARHKPLKATAAHEPVVPKNTTHLILVTGLDAVNKPLDEKFVHRTKLFSENTGLAAGEIINEKSIAVSITMEIDKAGCFSRPSSNYVILNKADTEERRVSGKKIANFLQENNTIEKVITTSLKDRIAVKDSFHCRPTT